MVLYFAQIKPIVLGSASGYGFAITSILYAIFSLAILIIEHLRKLPFPLLIYSGVSTDIVAIIFLMHFSGGQDSGLGILLVVAMSGSSILTKRHVAIFFAAIASLAILGEQIYSSFYLTDQSSSYPQTGILGIVLFTCTFSTWWLAQKIRETDELAKQRGIDLENLSIINDYIIQNLDVGIIVVDCYGIIRLLNQAAYRLLATTADARFQPIQAISPPLASAWSDFTRFPNLPLTSFKTIQGAELQPHMTAIGQLSHSGAIITLEDTSLLNQRAQQIKLASLGKLAASIAHEVRNPLGAISHAAQLMEESNEIGEEDQKLLKIILTQSKRINKTIENILNLSRKAPPTVTTLLLSTWTETWLEAFCLAHRISPEQIVISISPEHLTIMADASQLYQILWNLAENVLRHAQVNQGKGVQMHVQAFIPSSHSQPVIEIVDFGPKIGTEILQNLFEPFTTSQLDGTGLGLYLARELCQLNHAHLSYRHTDQGNIFSIQFKSRILSQD